MCILKHSNKYLLALFVSHVFFVIIIQAAPRGQTSEAGSSSQSTAASSSIQAAPRGQTSEGDGNEDKKKGAEDDENWIKQLETFFEANKAMLLFGSEENIKKIMKDKGILKEPSRIDTVLKCKMFLLDLFSQGERSSNKNFHKIIAGNPTAKIGYINRLAEVQDIKLDEAMLERMYKEHLNNRPKADKEKPMRKAVIVGGGPNGLFAAFKLFLSGIQVVLVNDRKEEYVRNQTILLHLDYVILLKILLGSAYAELFEKEESHGEIRKDAALISLKYLETALKKRLESLAKYVAEQPDERGDSLKLIYEHSVERIQFPTEENSQYYAVLKPIDSTKAGDTTLVSFDLLVCAGGTKDKIRNTYLGIPKRLTEPRHYAIAVLLKGDGYTKTNSCFSEYPTITNKIKQDYEKRLKNEAIEKYLEEKIKEKKLKNDVFKNISTHEVDSLIIIDNKFSLYLIMRTNDQLNKNLIEVKKVLENSKKDYVDFKSTIAKIWFTAIACAFIKHENPSVTDEKKNKKVLLSTKKKGVLNFDPNPVNTTIFEFVQQALDNGAVHYNVLGQSAIVLAVGDSAINFDFHLNYGFMYGRIGIQKAAYLIKKYNDGTLNNDKTIEKEVSDLKNLENELNSNFQNFKNKVLATLKDIEDETETKPINEQASKYVAQKTMSQTVKDMVERITETEYGFKITAQKKASNNIFKDFNIVFNGKTCPASVTDEGNIRAQGNAFATVVQAAMWLKEEHRKKKNADTSKLNKKHQKKKTNAS